MDDKEFDELNIGVLEELQKVPEDIIRMPPYIKSIIAQILADHKRIEALEKK